MCVCVCVAGYRKTAARRLRQHGWLRTTDLTLAVHAFSNLRIPSRSLAARQTWSPQEVPVPEGDAGLQDTDQARLRDDGSVWPGSLSRDVGCRMCRAEYPECYTCSCENKQWAGSVV